MSIVKKIQMSVKDSIGDSFGVYYGDDYELNLETSSMTFPCALLRLIEDGAIVAEGGQLKERVTAALFFVDKTEFDITAARNEEIIDACKRTAMEWISAANAQGDIAVAPSRTSRIYQRYDDIVTGFGILAEITELNGFCQHK